MYLDFYGFKQKPFALQPDPEFLFLSKRHRGAIDALSFSVLNDAPMVVITGEIGSGKTTLIRHFLDSMQKNVTVGLISNTHSDFNGMLRWVLFSYGINCSGKDDVDCYQLFLDFLLEEYAKGKKVLLIVDEAQNLSDAALEELRLLTNINSEKDQLIQLILIGQPQLQEKLKKPELEQFVQRISLHYHLEPLLLGEIQNYIRHRLRIAQGRITTFDASSMGMIAYYSRGIPRIINSLCDMSLLYGYAARKKRIDDELVKEVFADNANNSILFQNIQGEKQFDKEKLDSRVESVC